MRIKTVLLIWVIGLSAWCLAAEPVSDLKTEVTFVTGRVCVGVKCFQVDVADKPILRSLGLMGRIELAPNSGMWFVFDYLGKYTFWMKETLIPLDIIFVNERFEIVSIFENVPPCIEDPCPLYTTKENSLYVLEIPGGSVSRYQISLGDIAVYTQLTETKL